MNRSSDNDAKAKSKITRIRRLRRSRRLHRRRPDGTRLAIRGDPLLPDTPLLPVHHASTQHSVATTRSVRKTSRPKQTQAQYLADLTPASASSARSILWFDPRRGHSSVPTARSRSRGAQGLSRLAASSRPALTGPSTAACCIGRDHKAHHKPERLRRGHSTIPHINPLANSTTQGGVRNCLQNEPPNLIRWF